MFEAVEQARVEAIGARRMLGVARNLNSMLDDRFHRGRYDEITDRADAPIEDALAMIVRERLTGASPPPAARKIVELWQPWIEGRAGRDLDRLEQADRGSAPLRRRRARPVWKRSTWPTNARARRRRKDGESGSEDERQDDQGKDGQSAESEDMERMSAEQAEASPDQIARNRDGNARRRHPPRWPERVGRPATPKTASEPWRPRHRPNEPRGPQYRPFTTKFDEVMGAEELCDPDELERLRGYLDKQLANLQGVVARLANRLQRRLMAQQNRAWEFDLEEGMLDPARLARVIVDPLHPAVLQAARRTPISATRWSRS